MTLSILIPTYDYDARRLVEDLQTLALREGVEAEILVGDDGSPSGSPWLTAVEDLPAVRVLRYADNVGRAAHRNRMAEEAQGQWLLFTDCDAQVPPAFSLRRYLEATRHAAVVCGGLCNPSGEPARGYELRWRYEEAARPRFTPERLNNQERVPFRTFSFLIRRDVFRAVRFDETIRSYGYEDVLFGIQLERAGHRPYYIDNPLINGDIEPSAVYLAKSEEALRTLKELQGRMDGRCPVEKAACRLQRWHLAGAVRLFYRMFRRPMRRNLLGPHPNLTLFSLYKLGYFLT